MREWSFERWISLWHGGGLQAKQEKELQHVRDEKNLAYAFNCPFLVRILDYFQDKKQIYFLMVCTRPNSWTIPFVFFFLLSAGGGGGGGFAYSLFLLLHFHALFSG